MLRACLAFVLLTCAASPVLAQNGRDEVPASGAHGPGAPAGAPQDKPATARGYARPTTPSTSRGGGSDEDAVLRMRVPKWNSFLPGMFR